MASEALSKRFPWYDRWSQPTVPQLVEPLKAHHRRVFETFFDALAEVEGLRQYVAWYGPAWKWTIQYRLGNGEPPPPEPAPLPARKPAAKTAASKTAGRKSALAARAASGKEAPVVALPADVEQTICYLIPKVDSPMVCVPLSDALLDSLPMPRLSKFVRDGIKTAKYALTTHWAVWTPNNQSEAAQILDLLKRRVKPKPEPKPTPTRKSK